MMCCIQRPYFNPRSPHGEGRSAALRARSARIFQSTLPARGATLSSASPNPSPTFQSTLPARGATLSSASPNPSPTFQSTLPARGATYGKRFQIKKRRFQSTLPARGATRYPVHHELQSIQHFNPRSPHGERQSSPPRRSPPRNFNPRSPHGERPRRLPPPLPCHNFNPRSPHRERRWMDNDYDQHPEFQSTLPARGATRVRSCAGSPAGYFNPRSPHGERRVDVLESSALTDDFNPRSPHGERHEQSGVLLSPLPFQSTLPARGATFPAGTYPWGI